MSTKAKKPAAKKPAAKAPAAKKPVAKKPTAKAPAAKKPAAKKPAAAKAPAAKKPATKASAAKKPAAAKAPVVKEPSAAPAKPAKKEIVRKPITVVKKVPRPPLRKAEAPVYFENQSQDVAFSFAEMMKKRQKELDATRKEASDASTIKLSRRPTSRTRGGDSSQQFPASDLADFRKRLILLRQEAMGQSATLKTIALEHTDDRGSEDDDGSDAFMRLQNLSQVDSHNKVIQQIDEALARIQEGTYGICEICGQLIRKPRLMNLPFVRTCMECQSAMEENPAGMR